MTTHAARKSNNGDVRVVCPTGSLGLTPFHEESFWTAVEREPQVIAADAGSGDIGPFYLGSGQWYNPRDWELHDISLMLHGAKKCGAKVIIGSAGGAGLSNAVDRYFDIVSEVVRNDSLGPLKVARIYSEVDKEWLLSRLDRISPLGAPWPLTREVVAETSRAVTMIGVEPYLKALDAGADVIIAGRSCDDAVFAAVPIWNGLDHGLSLHMGKTIECGPLCATPVVQRETVMGTVRKEDFLVEPLHPGQRCTVASVAGHSLYERLDPYRQPGPGGELDLTASEFQPLTDRVVRVRGSRWHTADTYRLKIEGSARVGVRRLVLFGLRDPLSIAHLEDIFTEIEKEVTRVVGPEGWRLNFRVFGRDAILGPREPERDHIAHEVAVLAEAIADDVELASHVAKLVKYGSLRVHYEGKLGIAGGAALPGDEILAPSQDSYRWTIDHLVAVDDPLESSQMTIETVA
jgi:Acyclic terpene utilisation family protein AtuA